MSQPISDSLPHTINPGQPARHARRSTIGFLTALLRDPYATFTRSGVIDIARECDVNVLNLVGSCLRPQIALEASAGRGNDGPWQAGLRMADHGYIMELDDIAQATQTDRVLTTVALPRYEIGAQAM